MLTRVSASSQFSATAKNEIAEIINNQDKYPLILNNADNAQLDIFNTSTDIKSEDIKGAFEADGWFANFGSKPMIDEMVNKSDPRLPILFEKGQKSGDKYIGFDQQLGEADQSDLARGETISFYNRHTLSRNKFIPGILISASQINFLLAEYYDKIGNNSAAKNAFEKGLRESIDLYYNISTKSDDITVATPAKPQQASIDNFVTKVNWDGATNKIQLIAMQKWLHFNLFQAVENWSEQRRLDYPKFTIPTLASDLQKTVPVKLTLPQNEATYNADNYNAVKAQDNPNTKLFWDVN